VGMEIGEVEGKETLKTNRQINVHYKTTLRSPARHSMPAFEKLIEDMRKRGTTSC
jgi:hypothetical protein